jgi:hypothetical protein
MAQAISAIDALSVTALMAPDLTALQLRNVCDDFFMQASDTFQPIAHSVSPFAAASSL